MACEAGDEVGTTRGGLQMSGEAVDVPWACGRVADWLLRQ